MQGVHAEQQGVRVRKSFLTRSSEEIAGIFVCRVCILSARSMHRRKLSLSLKAQEVEHRVCQEGIRKSFEEDTSASVHQGRGLDFICQKLRRSSGSKL
jgi:hypothetical protein